MIKDVEYCFEKDDIKGLVKKFEIEFGESIEELKFDEKKEFIINFIKNWKVRLYFLTKTPNCSLFDE